MLVASMQLIVLGMHRSGGSRLIGLLASMGVHAGDAAEMVAPEPGDPARSWQRRDVRALCSGILAELGADEWRIARLDLASISAPARERWQRRLAAVIEPLDARGPWAIEDPRLALVLPVVRPALERAVAIVTWRHPVEVARALRASDGIPLAVGLALWEAYTARALEASHGMPRVLVAHDDLARDPLAALARLREELAACGVTGLAAPDEDAVRAVLALDGPEPRAAPASDELLSAPQRRLLDALASRAPARLDPVPRASDAALEVLADHEARNAATEARLDEWKDRAREALAKHQAAVRELEAARAAEAELRAEARSAREELERARAELGTVRARFDAADAQRARAAALERKLSKVQDEMHAILWSRRYRAGSALAEACRKLVPRFGWKLGERALERLRPIYKRLRGKPYEPVLPASMTGLVLTPRERPRNAARDSAPRPCIAAIVPHPAFPSIAPPVTVIVPVHDAIDDARACLESLRRNLTYPAEVLVIDDASADRRIDALCEELAALPGVRVLRNAENLGYTRTINRGIAACRGDVVLLNSDTEVGPRWLEGLVLAAYSGERVATVTAVSDNAGAFSVPDADRPNERPRGIGVDDAARVVAQSSARLLPRTPTGSGFCMYLRRAALDEIGPFDAERFPRGYGEENDFCMRAAARGWSSLVDDRTLVRHARSRSFGKEKGPLLEAGRQQLDLLYPDYKARVRAFLESDEMRRVREGVRAAYEEVERGVRRPRPRVLFVIHEGSGGTAETNRDLMHALDADVECLLLSSNGRQLSLARLDGGALVPVEMVKLRTPLSVATLTSEEYRSEVARILVDHAIELVHARHLFGHTLDLPEVATSLNVPVIASFHDYYYVCPTINLLDEKDRWCAGRCTSGEGTCRLPTRWTENLPPLKHRFVHQWRAEVERRVLARADACVTTTRAAKEVFLDAYPRLREARFEVFEHGRDLAQHRLAKPPAPGEPLRVLILGHLTAIKGGEIVRGIRALDREGRIQFHVLGQCHREYQDLAVQHGPYDRDDLFRRIGDIGPSVVALFSIWAETYSHTLSEAWAAGVPVVATDLGAFRERVRAHGGGWLFDPADARAGHELLSRIARDPEAWREEAARATLSGVRGVREMASDYLGLYRSVLAGRRTLGLASSAILAPARAGE